MTLASSLPEELLRVQKWEKPTYEQDQNPEPVPWSLGFLSLRKKKPTKSSAVPPQPPLASPRT